MLAEQTTATLEREVKDLAAMTHEIARNAAGQSQVNDAIVTRLLELENQVKTLSTSSWPALHEQLDEMGRRIDALWQAFRQCEPLSHLEPARRAAVAQPALLTSRPCTEEQFQTAWYRHWLGKLGLVHRLHRKLWELCYIAQALHERAMLEPDRRGLGFAVGTEPLPALFASLGCSILATDQDRAAAEAAGWAATNQHADSLASLNQKGICPPETFHRLVSFQTVDMNLIPPNLLGFDFLWSCCSLEHLGSIELGKQFVLKAMDCLRPGGIAIHTTEFNVSSDTDTVDHSGTVIFRRQDMQALADQLTSLGHEMTLDFSSGRGIADYYVDLPPYKQEIHLKLQLAGYVTTSMGLIIRKAG